MTNRRHNESELKPEASAAEKRKLVADFASGMLLSARMHDLSEPSRNQAEELPGKPRRNKR